MKHEDDPRFEIKNEAITERLRGVASTINSVLPEGWGFALFIFEYNGESFFWISSADRGDMIKALKEFIQREQPQ